MSSGADGSTALGGPLGGLAVEAAANALGLSEKTTDAVKQAVAGATPEQMLALKQVDQQFQVQRQQFGYKQVTDLEPSLPAVGKMPAAGRSRRETTGPRGCWPALRQRRAAIFQTVRAPSRPAPRPSAGAERRPGVVPG